MDSRGITGGCLSRMCGYARKARVSAARAYFVRLVAVLLLLLPVSALCLCVGGMVGWLCFQEPFAICQLPIANCWL